MPKVTIKHETTAEPVRDHSRAIGAILVEQGRLKSAEVDEIQRFARTSSMRFGEAALKLGLLTQRDIDLAIAQQFNYPIVPRGGDRGVADELVAAYSPQGTT